MLSLLKVLFLFCATIAVLVLLSFLWAVAQIPGVKWFSAQGQTGIDIRGISALTLHSPLYWLAVVAILAAAGWLCRCWVF